MPELELAERSTHNEPVLAHLKSLLDRCLKQAKEALHGRRAPSPAAVHDARKSLKKARAVLRLMRNVIGEIEYHRENKRLRNIGHALSGVRDAQVVMVTFDRALARTHADHSVRILRRRLEKDAHETHRTLDVSKRATIVAKLDSEIRRMKRYRATERDDERLRDGVQRIYRKGRNSFIRAFRHPADEPLHEGRKGAKYLSLALEALQASNVEVSRKAARHARVIGHLLGLDHDLAVLENKLEPLLNDSAIDGREIRATIARTRRKIRAKAYHSGRRLYLRKPGTFASRRISLKSR